MVFQEKREVFKKFFSRLEIKYNLGKDGVFKTCLLERNLELGFNKKWAPSSVYGEGQQVIVQVA